MRNKQKLIIFIGISMLIASSLELLTQKITLENYYKEKFEILINRIIPKDQYLVSVDIKLSDGLSGEKSNSTMKRLDNKTSVPEIKEKETEVEPVVSEEEDFFDLFGNSTIEEKNEEVVEEKDSGKTSQKQEETEEYQYEDDPIIEGMYISIYLDPSASIQQTKIQEILCESVYLQSTESCSNCQCISFNILDSGMPNNFASNDAKIEDSSTNENVLKEYELLIEQMRDDREREEASRISKETKKLEKELKSIEGLYESLRTQNRVEDSTKLAFYERKDRNLQRKRDSLLVVLEDKTEKARIAYYQQGQDFQQKQFDVMMELVKMKNGNNGGTTNITPGGATTYSPRQPYQNGNSSNMMMILILVILLGGFIGVFFALRQKPKPVYLKPKNKSENNGEKKEENNGTNQAPPVQVEQQANTEVQAISKQNNDVLKSEVKSLRQSAVSMSVGQKEAATKIMQDWLDEPIEGDNSQEESEKEE